MKFHEAGKVVYDAGLIFLPTMAKHQKARGSLIESHIRKIAELHRSNSNVAFLAFQRQFTETIEAPSYPLTRVVGKGEGEEQVQGEGMAYE